MKQFTPAIVNEIKKKSFFSSRKKSETRRYLANSKTEDIELMWMETNSMGAALTYPCVLRENGATAAYRSGCKAANNVMLTRWTDIISANNKDEFEITQIDAAEFSDLYNKAKVENDERDGLIEVIDIPEDGGDEDWTDEELLAETELEKTE